MTFHIKAEQERFIWRIVDHLPAATVNKWGTGYWVVCCPLCGGLHNLPANIKPDGSGQTYKPNCAIAKTCHRHMYHAWQEKHPESRNFDTVRLMLRQMNIITLDTPQIAAKKAA